jgi:hypothetical protein
MGAVSRSENGRDFRLSSYAYAALCALASPAVDAAAEPHRIGAQLVQDPTGEGNNC